MNNMISKLREKKNNKKGFTLIEMLIVVAIIAILVAIAVPTMSSQLTKVKKTADDASIKSAYTQHMLYEFVKDDPTNTGADAVKDAICNAKTITYSDGSTYTLQYYEKVDTSKTPWEGSTTS